MQTTASYAAPSLSCIIQQHQQPSCRRCHCSALRTNARHHSPTLTTMTHPLTLSYTLPLCLRRQKSTIFHIIHCVTPRCTNTAPLYKWYIFYAVVNVETIAMADSILTLKVSKSATTGSCSCKEQVLTWGKPSRCTGTSP